MRAVAPQMIANGGTVSQGNGILGVNGDGPISIYGQWIRLQAFKQNGLKWGPNREIKGFVFRSCRSSHALIPRRIAIPHLPASISTSVKEVRTPTRQDAPARPSARAYTWTTFARS